MVVIYEIRIKREIINNDELISDNELLEAVNEYYEEKEMKEKIKNDEYPLKGIRCAVCGSSRQ